MSPRIAVLTGLLVLASAAAAVAWWFAGSRARATVVATEHAEAELVAQSDAAEPGRPLLVALRLTAVPGWHTYWRNPGDSGQPTSLEWRLPPGFSVGAIRWPVPQRLPIGPLANYGYEGEVLLASELRVPVDVEGTLKLAARARWLVCNPEHCIPESAELRLDLPVRRGGVDARKASFAAIRLPQPVPAHWSLAARREGERVLFDIGGAAAGTLLFFPYEEGKVQHAAPQQLERAAGRLRLAIPVSRQPVGQFTRLTGILVADGAHAYEVNVPIESAQK